MSSPFSQKTVQAAAQADKKEPLHPAAETDIYRTFSPSEIAYWDFKSKPVAEPAAVERSRSSGVFSKLGSLFGFGGGPATK